MINNEVILRIIPWVIAWPLHGKWYTRIVEKNPVGCLILTNKLLAILPKVSMGELKKDGTKAYVNASPDSLFPFDILLTIDKYSLEDFHKDLDRKGKNSLLIQPSDFIDAVARTKTRSIGKFIRWRDNSSLRIEFKPDRVYGIQKYKDKQNGRELDTRNEHGLIQKFPDYDFDWEAIAELIKKHFSEH